MGDMIIRQRRYLQILELLMAHDLAWILERLKLGHLVSGTFQPGTHGGASLTDAERVRILFEELGPTFVKMGQILSTRPDLIPADFITELRKLQDNARKIPYAQICEVVEAAFEQPIDQIFDEIEVEPLAAASIGQVHRVVLPGGQRAVIKVQRPGIEETIRLDLAILRRLAQLAAPVSGPLDPVAIVREFERVILQELDFLVEGRKTDRFREQHAGDAELMIPEVYWSFTRKQVLALEEVDGIKISEIDRLRAAGHDCARIASKLVHTLLGQIFLRGDFHADPHPGNLMVLADGRLAMLDFGMSGHFDRQTRRALVDLMRDFAERDHIRMAEHLLEYELVGYQADLAQIRAELRSLMRSMDGAAPGQVAEDLMRFVITHQLSFPPDLFFLDKVFGTLDGAVRTLDPALDMRQLGASFAGELRSEVLEDWRGWLGRFMARVMEVDGSILEIPVALSQALARLNAGYLQHMPQHRLAPDGARQIGRLLALTGGMLAGSASLIGGALTASLPAAGGLHPLSLGLFGLAGLLLVGCGLGLWLSGSRA